MSTFNAFNRAAIQWIFNETANAVNIATNGPEVIELPPENYEVVNEDESEEN